MSRSCFNMPAHIGMLLGLLSLTHAVIAAPPSWWVEREVIVPAAPANDFAAANIGQLKHIAKQAYLEMEEHLPGGAGPAIMALIISWSQPPAQGVVRHDYAAVTQGQLKQVAKLFYDRLFEVGDGGPPLSGGQRYPWTEATTDDASYAIANVGQVKHLFSFDVFDNDQDGLEDVWEQRYFGTLAHGAADDPGEVGRTLAQSYAQELSPWPAALVGDGLRAWYRADLGVVKDASNKVSQWSDLSGDGFHVGDGGAVTRPLHVAGAMNDQPALDFDGSNARLQTTGVVDLLGAASNVTAVVVFKPDAVQGAQSHVLNWNESRFRLSQLDGVVNRYGMSWLDSGSHWRGNGRVDATSGVAQVWSAVGESGVSVRSYLNGQLQGSDLNGTFDPFGPIGVLAVGALSNTTNLFHGQVAEILIYNRALSDAERGQIEEELIAKYVDLSGDSDHDGLPDLWEIQEFGSLGQTATDDFDGDGVDNLTEYLQGRNPTKGAVPDTTGVVNLRVYLPGQ